ncbi:MAG TPA: DUF2911 domain-containing protein [Candidatus Acidoferrales bacterium]|nr:DUF2911 domain-containing protein [Candidatus Acidoferrales bacterium]
MNSARKFAFFAAAVFAFAIFASPLSAQQDKSKRPSPPASAQCTFADGKTLKVDYSSPRMRGRKIYGGLVPYGQVWRVGANEATTFVTDADLMVGDKTVPTGAYTLDAIPEPGKWTLIISKKTKNDKGDPVWGIPYPGAQYDFTRVPMEVSKLKTPLEDFTISFAHTNDGCSMQFDWDTTRATILIREKK